MTDQPRDLAKEVEIIREVHRLGGSQHNDIDTLLEHIASQSRELEEMRNSIQALVDGPPAQMSSPLGLLPINSTGMRTLVDEVCKLQSELAALRDERNDWRKLADERSAEIVRLHRELRRPVVQSDEIAMALYELDAAVHAYCIQDGDYSPVKVIRDALDQAQREIEDLKKKLKDQEQWSRTETGALKCQLRKQTEKRIELQREIARLSSAPEERRDIQERQRDRKATGFGRPHPGSLIADVDTLLEDLRRYENSHAIVMGERDAALAKVERLEQDERESFKRAESFEKAYAGACERIERLEAASKDLCEKICSAIKAADDESVSLDDYMYDSDDCIRIVRETFAALAAADGQQRVTQCDPPCPVELCQQWSAQGICQHPDRYRAPSGTGDGVEGE